MKTLANPGDKDEILRRLGEVRPSSQARWGKMSAPQMICHLSDAFRSSMGEKDVTRASHWIPRPLFRWAALWLPFRWPQDFPSPREWDQEIGGTPPGKFKNDVRELCRLLDRFTRKPKDFEWTIHPYFGRLSDAEWMRLGYLHMDHHLRQFDA